MPWIPNRSLKRNPFTYFHLEKRKHDWLPLTYPGVPKYLWEIPPKKIVGRYVPYKERQCMGFDELLKAEEVVKDLRVRKRTGTKVRTDNNLLPMDCTVQSSKEKHFDPYATPERKDSSKWKCLPKRKLLGTWV